MQYLKAVEWITLKISYINVVVFANEWWPFVLIWFDSGLEVKANFDQENVRQSPPTQAVGKAFPMYLQLFIKSSIQSSNAYFPVHTILFCIFLS